jgi:predicted nucleotidyltransferase
MGERVTMSDADFNAAHRCSIRHREQIVASERCGCFCCCSIFAPAEIDEWVDEGQTAMCPHCGADAVIGSASRYPISIGSLRLMESRHFEGERVNVGVVREATCALGNLLREPTRPLLFATISGAHLYGFPSENSDFDVRGAHILPSRAVLGLSVGDETIAWTGVRGGREIDLVTHDVRKFFLMLLKRNGYVLEQLYSPLVVHMTPEHEELKDMARGCVTRRHAEHYLGFFRTQWGRFEKERRIKPLLYAYRVLLTGTHLMQTGAVEADLMRLMKLFALAHLEELIVRKVQGGENDRLSTWFHK